MDASAPAIHFSPLPSLHLHPSTPVHIHIRNSYGFADFIRVILFGATFRPVCALPRLIRPEVAIFAGGSAKHGRTQTPKPPPTPTAISQDL